MSKRALWATRTASPANERKRRTARSADGAPRTSPWAMPVRAVIAVGSGTPGLTSVSNVAPAASASTRWAPISTIRERAGERPVVSRSKTTNEACSSRRRGTGWVGEPDRGAAPREPRVARDHVVEQRPCDRRRGRGEREERAGRVAGRHRALAAPRRARRAGRRRRRRAASVDPIRTYVRFQGHKREGPAGPSLVFHGGGRAAS